MKREELKLNIKHRFNEHYERFEQIIQRGMDAGLKKVPEDLARVMIRTTAALASYMRAAVLAEDMHNAGLPVDHMPEEIEVKITEELNKMDDIMTLSISSISV